MRILLFANGSGGAGANHFTQDDTNCLVAKDGVLRIIH